MKKILFNLAIVIAVSACSTTNTLMQSLMYDDGLSESEIVEGLKTALDIGANKAVKIVSDPDGYLEDQAIKIILPPEMNRIIEDLREAPGGEQIYQATIQPIVKDLVTAINRSASDAATQAGPIFKSTLADMSFADAWAILRGEYNNAGRRSATRYFQDKTSNSLANLFQPSIDASLDKPLIANTSANTLWDKFLNAYNAVRKSPANLLMRLEPVEEPDLSTYVTRRALDGLFVKIADEEEAIRNNPYQYTSNIIRKVFGDEAAL